MIGTAILLFGLIGLIDSWEELGFPTPDWLFGVQVLAALAVIVLLTGGLAQLAWRYLP